MFEVDEDLGAPPSKRAKLEDGDIRSSKSYEPVSNTDLYECPIGGNDGSTLSTTIERCVQDGPALLATHGVFSINHALSGDTLHEVQEKCRDHVQEILQIFYLQQALGKLGNEQFREINCRDGGRFDIRHKVDEPPLRDLSQNGSWIAVVKEILGEDVALLFCGVVLARGGSAGSIEQAWHQDGCHLFPESTHLPCHCLNVFLPLVDISQDNGPTEFVLGSHREDAHIWKSSNLSDDGEEADAVSLTCSAGTALVFDYRILHRGAANTTSSDRPCLYFTYAKPWFKDHQNLRGTRSILDLQNA